MRLAWCTDVHLDHLDARGRGAFAAQLGASGADAILITGDVSDAHDLIAHLTELADAVARPIHFVLGNHDFYGGSIAEVRASVHALCARDPRLSWLPACDPIALDARTVLVGCDGFGDGRLGDVLGTPVVLNDHLLIQELAGLPRERLARVLARLGDEEADTLAQKLDAIGSAERVLVATHVPPFREATWHEGAPSSDAWLPFFANRAVGERLRAHAERAPTTRFTVLTGHTHGAGTVELARNLVVHTGAAEYGAPSIAAMIDTALDALVA